ncbi:MAG: hypothetical protein R3A44_08645 [Caldilineaceae bacterium]
MTNITMNETELTLAHLKQVINSNGAPSSLHEEKAVYDADRGYTFSDYFRLNSSAVEIAALLGYTYERAYLNLPCTEDALPELDTLQHRLEQNLVHIAMTSEMARREFLIAPILAQLLDYVDARLIIERTISVNNILQGALDYYLEANACCVVIEAKNADLQRGFHQLMAEMAALDQHPETPASPLLYGAITVGDVWQFGRLHRPTKEMVQDLALYTIPAQVETLLRTLIAILTKENL